MNDFDKKLHAIILAFKAGDKEKLTTLRDLCADRSELHYISNGNKPGEKSGMWQCLSIACSRMLQEV